MKMDDLGVFALFLEPPIPLKNPFPAVSAEQLHLIEPVARRKNICSSQHLPLGGSGPRTRLWIIGPW